MTLDINTHRNILIRILKDIYTDTEICSSLGLKGGTAAYLFYGLDRFSVDLDFDLLDLNKENLIFEKLKNILKKYGSLIETRKKRFSLFYLLSYDNKIQNAYNIKIEVNIRNFESRYNIKSYLGIQMKVMVPQDMFAHKLVAMLERIGKTNRDIFDVYFFLKNNWPVNEKIIETRTELSIIDFIKKCINLIESLSSRNILSGIGELLDPKQKLWVKEKLKEETIFLLKLRLESIKQPPAHPRK